MTADELLAEAAGAPVRGWDFSRLAGRIRSERPPWDFEALVCAHARGSPDLLDLGTGGGEWLAALPCRPPLVVATEGYEPNVPVAAARLAPLGVDVVRAGAPDNTEQAPGATEPGLPFADDSFSLVVSRHEAYVAAEVARILREDGVFVTQQVGGGNEDAFRLLGRPVPPSSGWTAAFAARQLEAAGLAVLLREEADIETTFADVGAFAWWLRMVSFAVPFSIEDDRARLVELHESGTPLVLRQRRFLVEARIA